MRLEYDCSQIENYEELRKLQLVQVDILKSIDIFCKKNNIKYSLAYGTLLGAVRHEGYVPWDDDLDITMPREDYNKFLSLWKDTKYNVLQNYNTDHDFTQSFTKIRRRNTAFVQKADVDTKYNKGIYVDIFPVDRVPNGKIKARLQLLWAMFYQLFIREHPPTKNGKLIIFICKLTLKTTSKKNYKKVTDKLLKRICKYNNNHSYNTVDISVYETMIRHFDNDIFDNLVEVNFEDMKVPIFSKYDKMLKKIYGDYMKLPPKEMQTWSHHPMYISFEKEYD